MFSNTTDAIFQLPKSLTEVSISSGDYTYRRGFDCQVAVGMSLGI